ncbi:ribosome-binding factor A [Clostridium sp. USBA 49]|uniref:30S ribosome-binding factor RbfA n=1 Tax=Clostridium TaxID=1485 RepID=UPI0009997C77|nr:MULTISPECIES: 30S ribosome-binding factor RbfA [Clostridium]SKA76497.1 ribosome-binding factor A [Clostridium sp. USBA 49]
MVNYRRGKINEEIKRELSNIIHNDLKDPRLTAMISITNVEVTRDLRYGKVFVSVFGSEDDKNNSIVALKNSAGFLRRELGHRINLRYTPELIIELDNTIEKGMHIDSLIKKIKENNENA